MQAWGHLWQEVKDHLPFTVFATGGGLLLAGLLTYVAIVAAGSAAGGREATKGTETGAHVEARHGHEEPGHERHDGHAHGDGHELLHSPVIAVASGAVFHVFHPLHMLLSAIATTAMFWRHDRNLVKAVLTGVVGSIGICSISDVGMPYLSGLLLGVEMDFHLCIAEHPMLVLPLMAVGVVAGLLAPSAVEHSTQFSHAAHVFVSSMASILYLVSFGLAGWIEMVGYVFVVVVIAVSIPCCLSDIVFPLLVANREGLATCPDHNHLHRHTLGDAEHHH